ncbi:MAG: 5-methyltetrahydropteroyltriglutamate--homocysteine S-methyltransferase, partial [Tetragenococcus halophilus]
LIKKQEEVGLNAVTDGEFRRSWWHLDFFWGLNGVTKAASDKGYQFKDKETRAETARLTGKLGGKNHPFVEHFRFAKEHAKEDTEVKLTIPAPAQFWAELARPENEASTKEIYSTTEALVDGIISAYREAISEFYAAGVKTLQIDDCTWGMLAAGTPMTNGIPEKVANKEHARAEKEAEEQKRLFVTLNNAIIDNQPQDLVINTHICRGNYQSTWSSSGGYDNVSSPLFDQENVNAYYLEYDSDRAGGFSPLANVTAGKKVVLGLVTSKSGSLENREDIIARIREASQFVPLENLCLSPQCGFASTEEGNILTEEQQWNKIRFIKDIAQEVWKDA